MPRKSTSEKLVESCKGCQNAMTKSKICQVFKDPAYQWQKGPCWGRKGSDIIYFCGGNQGPTMDANDWRTETKLDLARAGFTVLENSLADMGFSDKEFIENELRNIRAASIILVDMTNERTGHIGAAMTMRYAFELHKEVYTFGEASKRSIWLKYHTTKNFTTLDEAIKYIKRGGPRKCQA